MSKYCQGTYRAKILKDKDKIYDKFLDRNVLEFKTKYEKDVIIIGVLVYEIDPSSNPSLPPELVLNDVMAEFFRVKGDDIIRDAVKALKKNHYDIDSLIKENLYFLDNLDSLDSRISTLRSDIKEDKEVGNGFRIGSNLVAGIGGLLCFTPLAPLGIAVGLTGAAGGIGTAIGTGCKKSDLSKEVECIQNKFKSLQEIQKIMQEFYNMIMAKTKAFLKDEIFVGKLLANLAKSSLEIGKLSGQAILNLASSIVGNVQLMEQFIVGFSNCVSSIGLANTIKFMPLLSNTVQHVQQAEKVGKLLQLDLARNIISQNTKAIAVLEAKQAQLMGEAFNDVNTMNQFLQNGKKIKDLSNGIYASEKVLEKAPQLIETTTSSASNLSKASNVTKLSAASKVLGAVGIGLNLLDIGFAIKELNSETPLEKAIPVLRNGKNEIQKYEKEYRKQIIDFRDTYEKYKN